jgi:HlyD family secretion protein
VEIEVTLDGHAVGGGDPTEPGDPDGVPSPDALLPGTSADVEVILATRDGVLRIPTLALVEGSRVLVIDRAAGSEGAQGAGTLRSRAVETGLSNWDWTEVTAGLEAGELVVTSLDRTGVEEGALADVESDAEAEPEAPDGGP